MSLGEKIQSKVSGSKLSESQPFLTPGVYKLKILRCVGRSTLEKGDAYIAEFTVLESSDPQNHPVGATRGWFQKIDNLAGPSAVLGFTAAVFGMDPKTQKEKVEAESSKLGAAANASVGDKNPFAGKVVHCQVDTITTKAGKPFSRHTFSPSK